MWAAVSAICAARMPFAVSTITSFRVRVRRATLADLQMRPSAVIRFLTNVTATTLVLQMRFAFRDPKDSIYAKIRAIDSFVEKTQFACRPIIERSVRVVRDLLVIRSINALIPTNASWIPTVKRTVCADPTLLTQ